MADGFQLNSGVPGGGRRENPEGVRAVPSANLPVPSNVPFVTPVNDAPTPQPDMGALSLARTLGNIDFGSLARTFGARSEAARKLREEQEQAAGIASTSQLLSQTGMDYDTLIQTGRIPASASPAFRLGASLAAADNELGRLRKAIAVRASENPNAPVFTDDPEFMSQFWGRLKGVRPEAVVKKFTEPLAALAADDTKRYAAAADATARTKFLGDAVGAFESAIQLGDPIEGALNNAINTLKLGNHKTPENMKSLILAAGPRIVEASMRDGKVDLARAGTLLAQVGSAKVVADGDKRLSYLYFDAFESLQSYVYGSVNRAAQAEKAQAEAQTDEATLGYLRYLRQNFSNIDAGTALEEGVKLGLDANTALNLFKGWDGAAGNKSQEERTEEVHEADTRSRYQEMTQSQRKQLESDLARMYREGALDAEDFNRRIKILHEVMNADEEAKAPIAPADRGKITDTLYNQMSSIFPGGTNGMQANLLGATGRYGLSGSQTDQVRRRVAERLTDTAISWIMSNPAFSEYTGATENVAADQAGPARSITRLTEAFLRTNAAALQTLVPRALSSDNPDSALSSLQLRGAGNVTSTHQPASGATRVYEAPKPGGSRFPNIQKLQQTTKAPARDVGGDARATVRAMGNIMNPTSNIFQWYKMDVRSRHPKLKDSEIMQRVKSMPPKAIRQLQLLYEQQMGGTR